MNVLIVRAEPIQCHRRLADAVLRVYYIVPQVYNMPMLTLRMNEGEYNALAKAAESRGLGISTYAKSLIHSQMVNDLTPARQWIESLERDPQLLAKLRRMVLFDVSGL